MRRSTRFLLAATMLVASRTSSAETTLPEDVHSAIMTLCSDCHAGSEPDGGLNLDHAAIDWDEPASLREWELVHTMVSKGIMPPPEYDQPSSAQRTLILDWIENELIRQGPIGGTPLRRLSAREYANTIRSVFQLSQFELPDSFPPDTLRNGFDNQGGALVVAVSHLNALAETAALVADEFFAPPRPDMEADSFSIPADDLVISYSSACLIDDTMRLASSGKNIVRNATWPSRFEAPANGRYRVEVTASAFQPDETAPVLTVGKMSANRATSGFRKDLTLKSETPESFAFDLDLDRGETIVFRYSNGPFDYEDKKNFETYLKTFLTQHPKLAAAWASVGKPPRGGSGWQRVKEAMESDEIDASDYVPGSVAVAKLAKSMASKNVDTGETLVYRFFEQGPAIAIHDVRINGPLECYTDRDDLRVQRQRDRLLGPAKNVTTAAELREFVDELLSRLLRRPATVDEVDSYIDLIQTESDATGDINRGLHLAIRTALISPSFLYRNLEEEPDSNFLLANRLSYFLSSGPPDDKLARLAADGRLNERETLVSEAKRILSPAFVRDFTTQWLGLDVLENLMPDTRLIRKFSSEHRSTMRREVEATFQHVLDHNLPARELVAPDFVFTDPLVGWEIYGLEAFRPAKKSGKSKKAGKFQQVAIERDGRRGGLLAMPAVMMATANGVDTQPVLRGVWVLENILGSPPPEPPNAVPALTPDITGANTPKDRLAAHMASDSCATCHREIDPLGFVLENFDPIGRWREHYPQYIDQPTGRAKTIDGARIDSTGVLPNGTPLKDITDLKRWLADNPQPFACCLSEKLMTYATGRELSFRERVTIREIVRRHAETGYRLRDLLMDLIDSEVFRTR